MIPLNPLTKEEPVSQPTEDPEKSKADRQRAFSIAYNEIKVASEGREVHRYMDDDTWSIEHKDLIESVREEAQKKYREDVRKLNAAAERKRIDAEAAAQDKGRAEHPGTAHGPRPDGLICRSAAENAA